MMALGREQSMPITPKYLGDVGYTGVYRISLADLKLAQIGEIALFDDRVASGGIGAASGIDIDFVRISPVLTDNPATAGSLQGLNLFAFNSTDTAFKAGYLTPW